METGEREKRGKDRGELWCLSLVSSPKSSLLQELESGTLFGK